MSWSSTSDKFFPVPVGSVLYFAGSGVPFNYILGNGDTVLKSDYPELFSIIGTDYGFFDATSFTLPNLTIQPGFPGYAYMKGTDTYNPVPSEVSINGINYTLPLNALPVLNNFSCDTVLSFATGNVSSTAVSNAGNSAPNGADISAVKADSSDGQFGANYRANSVVGNLTYTNATPTPVDFQFAGTYFPDNLGFLPCIRYTNSFPVIPVSNAVPTTYNSTINNPEANIPSLSGFIYSQ
jgi:microcystin-dependent protein